MFKYRCEHVFTGTVFDHPPSVQRIYYWEIKTAVCLRSHLEVARKIDKPITIVVGEIRRSEVYHVRLYPICDVV